MPRSNWKPVFKIEIPKSETTFIAPRHAPILREYIGRTALVHTGKFYLRVSVSEKMIGRKFGEFALTRRLANHTKKAKKKKS